MIDRMHLKNISFDQCIMVIFLLNSMLRLGRIRNVFLDIFKFFQNRFIVCCTKYTMQKHINIKGKHFGTTSQEYNIRI